MSVHEIGGHKEEPVADLAEIADRYFELYNAPIPDDAELSILTKQLMSLRMVTSPEKYNQVLLSAVARAKSLPMSLFISDAALAKLKKSNKDCVFEFEKHFSKDDLVAELHESYDTWVKVGGECLLARLDGKIIGFSVIEVVGKMVEIVYQTVAEDHLGVGLLMIREIIDRFQGDKNVGKIELATSRTPYGLGNLGFSLSEEQDPICMEINQLAFVRKFDRDRQPEGQSDGDSYTPGLENSLG